MNILTKITHTQFFATYGLIIARILFGGVFLMSAYMKFTGIGATAMYIASISFPAPLFFAWVAAFFELILGVALLTGKMFREAAMLAAVYILFLGFAFHGPSHWNGNQIEFGFFVDHLTFIAGLLFAIAHGPGEKWVWKK